MQNFTFYNPTKIIMGRGENSKIGAELNSAGISKVLLLYGGESVKRNGVYREVAESLALHNISYIEVGGVKPNPILSKAHEAVRAARENGVEAIVPIGGGSVMDSAKAIAAGALYDGNLWDFYIGQAKITAALPIFGVITLSATASEMNFTSVLTNDTEGIKVGLHSPFFFPRCSIIDPSVQFTVPEKQTVNGGIDAIAHILESYCDGTPEVDIQKEYAEGLLRSLITLIPRLRRNPSDYDARAQMAWASICALNGTTSAGHATRGDFSSHVMGHPISAQYDSVHGETLAVIMPGWMLYVYREDLPSFARLAEKVFGVNQGSSEEAAALEGIECFKRFFREQGAPERLRDLGVPENQLEQLANMATRLGPIGCLKKLNRDDVLNIYKSVY